MASESSTSASGSVVDEWGFQFPFNFDDVSVSKTPSSIIFLRNTLEKNLIFSSFINKNGSLTIDSLIKVFNGVKISKGQCIIKEGSKRPGYFYVVEKGKFTIHKTIMNGDAQFNLRLHQELNVGDVFGDMAFIHNCPRSASIVAEEDGILWTLNGVLFCKAFTCQLALLDLEKYAFINSLLLDGQAIRNICTCDALYDIYESIKTAKYEKNDVIFVQGTNCDYVNIIYHGIVIVKSSNSQSLAGSSTADTASFTETKKMTISKMLRKGDIFGNDKSSLKSLHGSMSDLSLDPEDSNNNPATPNYMYIAQGQVECFLLQRELYIQYFIDRNFEVLSKKSSSKATSEKSFCDWSEGSEEGFNVPNTARSTTSTVTNISAYPIKSNNANTCGLHSILTHSHDPTNLSPHRASTKNKKVEISLTSLKLDTSESMIHSHRSGNSITTTARSGLSDRVSVASEKNSTKSTARSVTFNDFDYPSLKSGR